MNVTSNLVCCVFLSIFGKFLFLLCQLFWYFKWRAIFHIFFPLCIVWFFFQYFFFSISVFFFFFSVFLFFTKVGFFLVGKDLLEKINHGWEIFREKINSLLRSLPHNLNPVSCRKRFIYKPGTILWNRRS